MAVALRELRQSFSALFDMFALGIREVPENGKSEVYGALVVSYAYAEYAARGLIIQREIGRRGLEEHTQEILECMGKTCARASPYDGFAPKTVGDERMRIRTDSDAILDFGLRYIEKWQMYHELLKG